MISQEDLKLIGQEVGKMLEDNMNPQFEAIRGDIKEIRGYIKDVREGQNKTDARLISLEQDFKEFRVEFNELKETVDRLFKRIDQFIARLDRQEAENAALRVGLERAEARITALEKKLSVAA